MRFEKRNFAIFWHRAACQVARTFFENRITRFDYSAIIFFNFTPIHQIPKRINKIRATVLIVQIISMLPEVDTENWRGFFETVIILIWRGGDFKLAFFVRSKPSPARTKMRNRRILKSRFEILETIKSLFDNFQKIFRRQIFTLFSRLQNSPKQRVIQMSATVISNFLHQRRISDSIQQKITKFIHSFIKKQIFQRNFRKTRRDFLQLAHCRVQIIDIRLMMFRVVNFHRPRVKKRLKFVVIIL